MPYDSESDDVLNDLIGLGKKSMQKSYFPQLQSKNRELIESEERYRLVAENIHDVIWVTDLDFNVTYVSPSISKRHGYTPEELINKNLSTVFLEEDFELMKKKIKTSINIGNSKHNETRYEIKFINKDHSILWIEMALTILYKENNPTGILGVSRDISERKEAEAEHRKIQLQLVQSQKMDAVGILAGGLAHDLNNVLSGIIAPVSILMDTWDEELPLSRENIFKYLEMIRKSGDRAVDIVNQLLTISRKQEINVSKIDLRDSLKNVVRIAENSFDKSIKLSPLLPEDPVLISGDPTQIEQVFLNLLVNAQHAMTIMKSDEEEWGGTLTLSVESFLADPSFSKRRQNVSEGEYWKISVSDTGVGMEEDQLEKIFDPFYSTKEKNKGTGLGLSMVYSIINQHKGFINIYSEKGSGSVFSVFLPKIKSDNLPAPSEERKKKIEKGTGGILIIDDEELLRSTARDMLKIAGYQTFTASDGLEGIQAFIEHGSEVDLILLDMVMPGINGSQTFLKLREIDPSVKVIITSGFKQDERIEKTLKSGAVGFLQKPYTIFEITELISRILKNK